jgi:hypothetical protein
VHVRFPAWFDVHDIERRLGEARVEHALRLELSMRW